MIAMTVGGFLSKPVPLDYLMLIGLVWTALGFLFAQIWWAIGGSILFLMGVLSLPSPKRDKQGIEGERTGDNDEKVQTPWPP